MKKLTLLLAMFATTVFAANISGTWKGTAQTDHGKIERTFILKAEGDKLTGGTISSNMGKGRIADGKIAGDTLSFTITVKYQGEDLKLMYTGKITGDEIKFHVGDAKGETSVDYVVKRVS